MLKKYICVATGTKKIYLCGHRYQDDLYYRRDRYRDSDPYYRDDRYRDDRYWDDRCVMLRTELDRFLEDFVVCL